MVWRDTGCRRPWLDAPEFSLASPWWPARSHGVDAVQAPLAHLDDLGAKAASRSRASPPGQDRRRSAPSWHGCRCGCCHHGLKAYTRAWRSPDTRPSPLTAGLEHLRGQPSQQTTRALGPPSRRGRARLGAQPTRAEPAGPARQVNTVTPTNRHPGLRGLGTPRTVGELDELLPDERTDDCVSSQPLHP